MKSNYLAVFLLPFMDQEHSEIPRIIRDFAGGDCKNAFVGNACAGWFFSTDKNPWDISFSKVLMNSDSLLIVELGQRFHSGNLPLAATWLHAHLGKPRK